LKKIKDKNLLKRVREVIDEVKQAKDLSDLRNLSKLKGYQTFYRIGIGDYRVGLDVVEGQVIFTRILPRKDIYKYFP
jgi:mRNA interferase RelE/StbE